MRGGDPMTEGRCLYQVQFYPHARGWSNDYVNDFGQYVVLPAWPACAGVIPVIRWQIYPTKVLPACAGVIPHFTALSLFFSSFTRMRGGDPAVVVSLIQLGRFYPHARGWSRPISFILWHDWVLPACAGVIPRFMRRCNASKSFTRMRGGDPLRWIGVVFST